MIGGISAAVRGVAASSARFEQAVGRMAAATSPDAAADASTVAAGSVGISDAMVQMATARFAFVASLRAAQTTNAMLGTAMQLGGYGR